ncbi:hypothetical protein GCM10011344_27490 [Dokdonia pacifica]|uniref:histidine kinase n=1 Tax=Dokdonia pacifica TaxID=1627892 RepID=A0A239CFM7_9FLAO|nr:tetratricopeptide repeat protein [Dokdonia pacifica]GGG25315.1 hypothetical protein GCM10011344_27490 [Dokdonia pacifica]SNS18779.1 Two-component sensor histidine kinase, contains HisKA and HATPase domains [Dokdonia pacifica]
MKVYLKIILLIFTICSCFNYRDNTTRTQKSTTVIHTDSISYYLGQSKIDSLELKRRVLSAEKAYLLSTKVNIDTLTRKSLKQILKTSYKYGDRSIFFKYYPKSISFSKIKNDTALRASTHNYVAYFYLRNDDMDSAYHHFYNGSKFYKHLRDSFSTGKMLANMAIIQKNRGDYVGSESVCAEALSYLSNTTNRRYLASVYNNIGIISNELMKYNKALSYHNEAYNIRKELKDNILIIQSLNNISVVYKRAGNYAKAIKTLDTLTYNEDTFIDNQRDKARIIDNLSHARLLQGDKDLKILRKLEEALFIREKEKDISGLIVSLLNIADYYKVVGQENIANEYAIKARELSKRQGNYRDILNSLKFLSLSSTIDQTPFIKAYYKLADSLELEKNNVSDHFALIRYESDTKEEEINKAIKKAKIQQRKIKEKTTLNILLVIVVILVLFTIFLLRRSSRTKEKLYKEFNHRTRNNLKNIIHSIYRTKKKHSGSSEILNDVEGITQSQLLIYSILEKQADSFHVDLKDYLQELFRAIIGQHQDINLDINYQMDTFKIEAERASIIGLICNEYMTNAYKYAFSEKKNNTFTTYLKKETRYKVLLILETSGVKWTPEILINNGSGLKIISSLADKIDSKLNIRYDDKTGKTILSLQYK